MVNHFDLIKNVKSWNGHTYGWYVDFHVFKIMASFDKDIFEMKTLPLCIRNLLTSNAKLHKVLKYFWHWLFHSKVINQEKK